MGLFRALAKGLNAIAEAEKASRADSSARRVISDDEKKKQIIHVHRRMWTIFCNKAETQVPMFRIQAGDDGSGCLLAFWESEDAMLHTAALLCPGGEAMLSRPMSELRPMILRKIEESWEGQARVRCERVPGDPAQFVVKFGSLREALDVMYSAALETSTQLDAMESRSSAMGMSDAISAQQQLAKTQAECDFIMRESEAAQIRAGQAVGSVPLYYQNGVPHYGGIQYS